MNTATLTKPDTRYEPADAAKRLGSSLPTLARWRSKGTGPEYLKLGGKVFYTEAAIAAFEAKAVRQRTR